MMLIGADLPYLSPRVADGAWALFAYPKLYGALLLWATIIWASRWTIPPSGSQERNHESPVR